MMWDTPPHSQRSGTTTVSATFVRQRARFLQDLEKLEANTTSVLDTLKLKASKLGVRLKDLDVWKIILKNESNPDFMDSFGLKAEDLLLWLEETECKF